MTSPISTKLTKIFDITSPIVSAPMAYAATPEMVAAVINAGGLGFLGAGNEPASRLAEDIAKARSLVPSGKRNLVGMGFVGWVLDMFNKDTDPRLQTVLEEAPAAIWLAFGKDLAKYVKAIRDFDAARSHKTLIFVIVNTVEEALTAANDWKVDALVAQGAEAGGRGSTYSPPLIDFLQSVLTAIPNGPLILAAGGITTGAQIAAALTMGAAGVVLGTRLLFTDECMWNKEMKDELVAAGSDSTVRSPAFDLVFPPGVWPKGVEARCLKNGVYADFTDGVSPEQRKSNVQSGKKEYQVIYAGLGAAHVDNIQPTKIVVDSLHHDTVKALKYSTSLVA